MEEAFRAAEDLYRRNHVALNLTDRPICVNGMGIIIRENERAVYCHRPQIPAQTVMEEAGTRYIFVPCAKSLMQSC